MARVTDTRAQVRKIADQLAAAGKAPTPTLVKQLLGKGSPNTIVSELAAWRAARAGGTEEQPGKGEVPTSQALARVGAHEAAELVKQAATVAAGLGEVAGRLEQTMSSISELPGRVERLVAVVDSLAKTVAGDREWMTSELTKAHERYNSVQRYAMQAIDAAREETRAIREKLKESGEGGLTRENAFKRQIDELRLVVATLKGRLEERGTPATDVTVPAPLSEKDLNPAHPPWKVPR